MTIQKARRLRSKSGVGNDGDDVVEVGFVEPVLNDSTIITGQKLEDPPTAKIMKELGAFHKNNPVNTHYNENIEEYNKNLQSQKLIENNTDFSNIRYHSEKSNNGEETPDFTSNNVKNGISKPKSRKKTILNRLKKSYQELVDNSSPISSASTPNEDVDNEFDQLNSGSSSSLDPTSLNQDFCSCCGMVGMFLCCESCPKSYHFQCINPPIDSNDLPDSWYCKDCIKKKTLKNKREIPVVNVGIYSKLFDNIQFQDSISFQLPTEIIDSFQGISIDKFGDYKDDSVKPEKSYKQLIKESEDPFHGIYKPSNGSNTISDPEPYFCYHCGLSGLNNRELINCDYCPLSWHLDCLDPPLTSIKQIGSKWKCPNHIDDLDTPVRKFKSQEIVEIASLNNFEKLEGKLPINAQVEIVSIEEKLRNLKEQAKQMNMGISKSNLKFNNLIFKVNEEDIILNFINSTKIKEVSSNNENVHNLMNLKPNLKDYVLSLSKLSKKSVISNEMRKVNLQELLKITNDELKEETADFTVDEIKEYKLIRKLITLKGKDKLLEFLNS